MAHQEVKAKQVHFHHTGLGLQAVIMGALWMG
jgi:hypothetical protein